MKFNTGHRYEDLEDVYTVLCERIDEAGPAASQDMLARLCILLIGEMQDKAAVLTLIEQAQQPEHAIAA